MAPVSSVSCAPSWHNNRQNIARWRKCYDARASRDMVRWCQVDFGRFARVSLWPLFEGRGFDYTFLGKMERSLFENVFIFTLNMTAWMWGVVSFLPWYYLSGRKKFRPRNKIQARLTSNVPGSPYRCVESFDSLATTPYDGVHTLDQLFR